MPRSLSPPDDLWNHSAIVPNSSTAPPHSASTATALPPHSPSWPHYSLRLPLDWIYLVGYLPSIWLWALGSGFWLKACWFGRSACDNYTYSQLKFRSHVSWYERLLNKFALQKMGNLRKTYTTTGNEGCPCIDTTATLASLDERSCTTTDEQHGVLLTVNGPCVPHSYGASYCLRHDLNLDPACKLTSSGEDDIPGYCIRSFCYVDARACMSSTERVYRSNYFPADSGVDMVRMFIWYPHFHLGILTTLCYNNYGSPSSILTALVDQRLKIG